ncbi:MAG TPA: hypothetical protein PKO06_24560 [Candidatus Ozemobacteraceae bacterium]|nr:hypothetical protein [Candidatus Ozemobacteraceae bacterium]
MHQCGQKQKPHIVYLFTETVNERIKGDLRILEILEKKDEQANFNLGDPSAFLNVYDPDKEAYIRQPGGGAAELSDELNFAYNLSWFENTWADTFG